MGGKEPIQVGGCFRAPGGRWYNLTGIDGNRKGEEEIHSDGALISPGQVEEVAICQMQADPESVLGLQFHLVLMAEI